MIFSAVKFNLLDSVQKFFQPDPPVRNMRKFSIQGGGGAKQLFHFKVCHWKLANSTAK